ANAIPLHAMDSAATAERWSAQAGLRLARPRMRRTGTGFCGRPHGAGDRPLLRSTYALAARPDLADAPRIADALDPLGPFRPRRAVGRGAVHSAAHRRGAATIVTAGGQGP